MERSLNLFSLAFLGVVFVLFLVVFAGSPIGCSLGGPPGVRTPWSNNAAILDESEKDLTITVAADGRIFVGSALVPAHRLPSELSALARRTSTERPVIVRADGSVPYAVIQDILAASRSAGFEHLSLATFRGTRLDAWNKGGAV